MVRSTIIFVAKNRTWCSEVQRTEISANIFGALHLMIIHHCKFLQILRDAVANPYQKISTRKKTGIIYFKSPYAIIKISGKTNVTVVGGTINGERDEHLTPGNIPAPPYTDPQCTSANSCYGQWGMGITISGVSDIYIDGVLARDCWGDGFYVDGYASNVNFYSVVADYNRRQGMSIVYANGVIVRNSIFKNTRGHNPQAGIDLEPNGGKSVTNIQILNCQFYDNYHSGIALNGKAAPLNNVTITGNTISPNTCLNGSALTVHPASLSFGNVATGSTSPEQSYNLAGGIPFLQCNSNRPRGV